MIFSDPSFERPHWREHYALYFETGKSRDYANICNYRPIFDRLFPIF